MGRPYAYDWEDAGARGIQYPPSLGLWRRNGTISCPPTHNGIIGPGRDLTGILKGD
jgi:hypothetical protein